MIRRLHRDDSAQVTFLALAASLVLIGTMAMIINTGDVTRTRIRNQEVADVTAMAAATWTARGMNTVSMLNVLNAKLLSMTVLVNALDKAMPVYIGIGEFQVGVFTPCSALPFCAIPLAVATVSLTIHKPLYAMGIKPLAQSVTRYCQGAAWSVMKGISKAADAVSIAFPAIGYAEGYAIAQDNGASFGMVVGGAALQIGDSDLTEALSLPVTTDNHELADFCPAMTRGGPGFVLQGYDQGVGPAEYGRKGWNTFLWISAPTLLAAPTFGLTYDAELRRLGCDGSSESNKQTVQLANLSECREYGAKATWAHFTAKTGLVDEADWGVDDFIAWVPEAAQQTTAPNGDAIEAVNHRPVRAGREAVISERPVGQPAKMRCGTGYPGSWKMVPDTALPQYFYLNENPDYMHYEVTEQGVHRRSSRGSSIGESAGTYYLKVDRTAVEVANDDGSTRNMYQYEIDEYMLVNAGEKEMEGEELEEYIEEKGGDIDPPTPATGAECGSFPIPHLLPEDAEDGLRFFSVVRHDLGGEGQSQRPFWSNYFTASPSSFTGFSQAQVYNDLSTDMFTQDWRVRLERATLLEAALARVEELGLGVIAGTASDVLTTVNNH